MRIGKHPEKKSLTRISYKAHRVIIPVYIPDTDEEYFINLFEVFKLSIQSLLSTTNTLYTSITIINNNCKYEVTKYIDDLLKKEKIDKHVKYTRNYGKVYSILSEAKASYEDIITIADADIYYFDDWLLESINIFNSIKKVGVVSPVPAPHLSFYHNSSLWFSNFYCIIKKKIISENSFKLFEEGIGNPTIFTNSKPNCKKGQYIFKKNLKEVCVGSGHFIATYRKEVFDKIIFLKPIYIFRNGDEELYLDNQIDKLGFFRVSTIETYAYHLGNKVPEWIYSVQHKKVKSETELIKFNYSKIMNMPFIIKKYFTLILKKFR